MATPSPFGEARIKKDLEIGTREHDGTNVPAVHDHAACGAECTLLVEQCSANLGKRCHRGGSSAHCFVSNRRGDVFALQAHLKPPIAPGKADVETPGKCAHGVVAFDTPKCHLPLMPVM